MSSEQPLACGYVRGSTVEQIDTLTAQAEHIRKYCEFKGLALAHPTPGAQCFIDSGTSGTVPFYERACAASMVTWMAETGVKHLILAKLDRGFRDALDCLFTVADLEKKGVTLHILDIQLDMSTPVGKLIVTVLAAIAEMENKRRSERQKDAFKVRRAENKICGAIPYGYRLGDDDESLEPIEGEQAILARLLTGDLAACSCNEAARRLNAADIPAKQGGKWHGATIANLRRNSHPETKAA